MSHFCIKYKNHITNEFDFLFKNLKYKDQKISKFNLINYLYSNNTNSVYPVIENEKKLPTTNLDVFDYYKDKLNRLNQIDQENIFYNKIVENIAKHKKHKKNAILLSGGSDSILIAAIVTEIYGKDNIIGLTLDDGTSFHTEEINRAKIVANDLGIKHYVVREKTSVNDYLKIISRQANSIDRSSVDYDKLAKKIIEHYGNTKVDVLNGDYNFLELGVSENSDPTRHIRDYIFRNKKKISFLKFFEFFNQGKLRSNLIQNFNNKYLMTLNDIIRFIFEKKTDLEYMSGFYNGKSHFPGYHGLEKHNDLNFKDKFMDCFSNIKFRNISDFKEFFYLTGPHITAGTTNVETVTNIMESNGLNMIFPFSSDELYAITINTKYYKNKKLQKDLINRKYKINNKVVNFVKNHKNFNKYFSGQFDNKTFLKLFESNFFEKLKQNINLDYENINQINLMLRHGIKNQRQFRIFVVSQIFNTFNVK